MTHMQYRTPGRCPACGKRFKSRRGVLAHMNQPHGVCQAHVLDLVKISPLIRRKRYRESYQEPQNRLDVSGDVYTEIMNDDYVGAEDHIGTDAADALPGDVDMSATFVEMYPGASQVYGTGPTFLDHFHSDQHAANRMNNLYYPFASRDEWELASFLLRSRLSMSAIDEFLSLQMPRRLQLSFQTAKELRNRAEILPRGPKWECKPWKTTYPTKSPVHLFYRDSLECVQSLLHCPLVQDSLDFTPLRVFKTAEKVMRVYTEWRTGTASWEMQSRLPPGATLVGTILSSDKTTISAMTGNRVAHPLLLSLANLDMDFRMKASNHAFLLIALLPVPKFLEQNKRLRGVLESRLIHECLDLVLQPLKKAAEIGVMMSDPLGGRRYCYTPLVAYIVDTPEAALIAGVAGKTSSVTMASYKQFGDPFQHEPRTASRTIAQLLAIESTVHPWDLANYFREAQKHRLNGVHRPFWRDWALAEPSLFLTPEPLHHWSKMSWDHDIKWCIRAVGDGELDFRFSVLHPHIGYQHFSEGISKLKQVTGRDHRDIQRYLIPVIAGAVPKRFLIAIRALIDFRYLAQAREIDENMCTKILAALKLFHDHKDAVVEAGVRIGKHKKVLDDWQIPKLEFMQSVVANIRANGVPIQWSADTTEHAHITEIKDPARSSNNQNYETQICRYLDRGDKCRRFDLATSACNANVTFQSQGEDGDAGDKCEDDKDTENGCPKPVATTSSLLAQIQPVSTLSGAKRCPGNYFEQARSLESGQDPSAPLPLHTFACSSTALHLNRDPSFKIMSIDDVADKFHLPDLCAALADYLQHFKTHGVSAQFLAGRRMATAGCKLSFDSLKVWSSIRIQVKEYFEPHNVLPATTLYVSLTFDKWPLGRYDTVVINTKPDVQWPYRGLEGHCIGQLRLIMCAVPRKGYRLPPGAEYFLSYVQRFDIVPQPSSLTETSKGPYPDPVTSLYVVKRAKRTDGSGVGGVIPLGQLRTRVELTPRFGAKADPRLTKETSLEYCSEFWVDKYFDKDFFFAMTLPVS